MSYAGDRLMALAAVLATAAIAGCGSRSEAPLSQQAYVWQRTWTSAVSQAVRDVPRSVSVWRVLVAETDATGGWRRFDPDVTALESGHRALIAVIRIDGQRRVADADLLAGDILRTFETLPDGVWGSLEIDYDCPTNGLSRYARLLTDLRSGLPSDIGLSITALPAWIGSDHLRDLLSIPDQSVLQVHSVIDPHRGLFDPTLARAWIEAYARVSPRPFSVALPDYGSRVEFDTKGRLVDVISEDEDPGPERAGEELQADPVSVAGFLAALRVNHPSSLRGVVWFRLPVEGDQRSWSTATWRRVMSGEALMPRLVIGVLKDSYGAYQIRLSNSGNVDAPMPGLVVVPVGCPEADGEDLYEVQQRADRTVWRLSAARWLPVGHSVRVGWIRCRFEEKGVHLED
ncbi:MAG TPA: DUF3142 domain-containing protein [Steroidobacteraceae bacterium]|nr:DUF3142 domain-containing protein [Steroidobacteraceae bacterium]